MTAEYPLQMLLQHRESNEPHVSIGIEDDQDVHIRLRIRIATRD